MLPFTKGMTTVFVRAESPTAIEYVSEKPI